MNYVYTVLGTTLAIIIAEIVKDYSLGDVVKDAIIRLLRGPESLASSLEQRAQKRLVSAKTKAAALLVKVKAGLKRVV